MLIRLLMSFITTILRRLIAFGMLLFLLATVPLKSAAVGLLAAATVNKQVCDSLLQSFHQPIFEQAENYWRRTITKDTPVNQVLKAMELVSSVKDTQTIAIRTKIGPNKNKIENFHRARLYPAEGQEVGVMILLGGLSRSLEAMHHDFQALILEQQKHGLSVITLEALGQGLSHVVRHLREGHLDHQDAIDFETVQAPSTAKALQEALIRLGYLASATATAKRPIYLAGESYSGQLTARLAMDLPRLFTSWTTAVSGCVNTTALIFKPWAARSTFQWIASKQRGRQQKKELHQQYYTDDLFSSTADLVEKQFPHLQQDRLVRNGVVRMINGMLLSSAFEDIRQMPSDLQKNILIAENDEILPPIVHYWMHALAFKINPATARLIVVRGMNHHMLNHASAHLNKLFGKVATRQKDADLNASGVYEFYPKTGSLKPLSWAEFKAWVLNRSNEWIKDVRRDNPGALAVLNDVFFESELTIAPEWVGINGLREPRFH